MDRVQEKSPKNSYGYTPLHKASKFGKKAVVEYITKFLDEPIEDCQNFWGETPLNFIDKPK